MGLALRSGMVAVGSVLLVIGVILVIIGFQGLQTVTSPAGQALLFFATQAERDAAWARVNLFLFGGGILSVIGLIALVVGAVSRGEPQKSKSP